MNGTWPAISPADRGISLAKRDRKMCDLSDHSFILTTRGSVRRVDACIRALVQHLNDNGIMTYDSCCGHGESYGHVTIGEEDTGTVGTLGFRVCAESGAGHPEYPFVVVDHRVNIILDPVIFAAKDEAMQGQCRG